MTGEPPLLHLVSVKACALCRGLLCCQLFLHKVLEIAHMHVTLTESAIAMLNILIWKQLIEQSLLSIQYG